MNSPFFFRCINQSCQRDFDINEKLYQCPACSDLLDIAYDFEPVDVDQLKAAFSRRRTSSDPLDVSGVWRYLEFLPFRGEDLRHVVTLGEGNSPILEVPRCAEYVGLERLRIKHLGWNPSGSSRIMA